MTPEANSLITVLRLGWAGLIPFYAAALLSFVPCTASFAAKLMQSYGLGILCFLAGTLWGSAPGLPPAARPRRLIISNLLVLLLVAAWLWLPPGANVALQLALFWLFYYLEVTQAQTTGWYLRYRLQLTACVTPASLMCLLALLS